MFYHSFIIYLKSKILVKIGYYKLYNIDFVYKYDIYLSKS